MDELKKTILDFSKSSRADVTPRELKLIREYITDQALEYYRTDCTPLDHDYLKALLEDIREDML